MTLGELIALARVKLRDTKPEYLWSDTDLTEFANAAQDEACARARLLFNSTNITLTSTDVYVIPNEVVRISDVYGTRADGTHFPLQPKTYAEMRSAKSIYPACVGTPELYMLGADNTITLYPTPNNPDDTITVSYSRMPTADERMTGSSDEPVIPAKFHRDLVHWMLYEAYQVHDADTVDKNPSRIHEDNFTKAFGYRITARGERMGAHYGVGNRMYPVRLV